MSNYSYKGVPISSIVKYITNTAAAASFKMTNAAMTTTTYVSPFTSITETPNNLQYQYNSTDISSFCISNYVEVTSSGTVTTPSWCTSMRIVLIGGGAKGISSGTSYNQYTAANQQDYNVNARSDGGTFFAFVYSPYPAGPAPNGQYDYDQGFNFGANKIPAGTPYIQQHQHHTASSDVQATGSNGSGGGSGGFVYFNISSSGSTLQNITIPVTIGAKGNSTSTSGGATSVSIFGNTITAGGGSNVGGANDVSRLSYITTATTSGTINDSGSTRAGTSGGVISKLSTAGSLTYGAGGTGGSVAAAATGSTTSTGPNAGVDGNAGYVRIYYLL